MIKEIEAHKKGYRVTEQGSVISHKGLELSLTINKGYYDFSFRGTSINPYKVKVHRLQAFQKYGMKLFDEGIEVRHKNNVKTDNSYDNILIGTHSKNMMDIPENIRKARSLHATSFVRKYKKEKVKEFHIKNGNSYKETMEKFNISSKGTLHFILNN